MPPREQAGVAVLHCEGNGNIISVLESLVQSNRFTIVIGLCLEVSTAVFVTVTALDRIVGVDDTSGDGCVVPKAAVNRGI